MSLSEVELKKQLEKNEALEREQRIKRVIRTIHHDLNVAIRCRVESDLEIRMSERRFNVNHTDQDIPTLPVQAAAFYGNDQAFDAIVAHKDFDPNKRSIQNTTPLWMAAIAGKEKYVQKLLDMGADPKAYCGSNALFVAIVQITSLSIFLNSNWRYEGETSSNAELTRTIYNFFNRTGSFTPTNKTEKFPAGESIPFPKSSKTIHAYYTGKTGQDNDVIGVLLHALRDVKGRGLDSIVSGTDYTPLKLIEDPLSCKDVFEAGDKNKLEYVRYEGNDVHQLKMRFFECTNEEFVEIIVHYDMGPTKKALLTAKATLPSGEIQDLQKAVAETKAKAEVAHKGIARLELKSNIILKDVAELKVSNEQIKTALEGLQKEMEATAREIESAKSKIKILAPNAELQSKIRLIETATNKNKLLILNAMLTELDRKFSAFKIYSDDTTKRDDKTVGAYVGLGVGFIGDVLPSPLDKPFKAIGKLIELVAYEVESRRYKAIGKILPMLGEVSNLVKEISVATIEKIEMIFAHRGLKLEQLSSDECLKIAKLAYGAAVYTVYEYENLDIKVEKDKPVVLSYEERCTKIRNKVLGTINDHVQKCLDNLVSEARERIARDAAKENAKIISDMNNPRSRGNTVVPMFTTVVASAAAGKSLSSKSGSTAAAGAGIAKAPSAGTSAASGTSKEAAQQEAKKGSGSMRIAASGAGPSGVVVPRAAVRA